jgi:acetyl-CoA acetyltransferase
VTSYNLQDKASIAGIGMTPFTTNSGVSETHLAVDACKRACDDAGVDPRDVDAIGTFSSYGEGVSPVVLAGFLGHPEPPQILFNPPFGGNLTAFIFNHAAMAVATGTSQYVLLFKAYNGRSGYRMGGTGTAAEEASGDRQYLLPFGMHGAPANFAMSARQYAEKYGIKPEQVGHVAVAMREHAQRNPHARFHGRPITLDDYLASRPIVDPFKLLDCCVEIDGACAFLVTTTERARSLKKPPVLIRAAAYGYRGMTVGNPRQQPGWHGGGHYVAPRLYERAGMNHRDIDVAGLADDYTYSFLPQLEEYGWCGPGEAADFCAAGSIKLGGEIPCNTSGGGLSEGFLHGMNLVVEAVTQLRGEAGDRQVQGAEVALVTGTNGSSGAILRRDS